MRRILMIAITFLSTLAPALAADPPYLTLAQALGTPDLAYSYGPADKSQMLLEFVPKGETKEHWTKMTTVSIARVLPADTAGATRDVIARFRSTLQAKHAHIATFEGPSDESLTAYFEFSQDGENQKAIVYSPDAGFVTVAQVGVKGSGTIAAADVKKLKSIIGR